MTSLRSFAVLRIAMLTFTKPAILLATVFIAIDSVYAIDFSIGAPEIVYTKSQRKSGGSNWPDGNLGVISNGNGTYDFYGANGTKPIMTTGTLLNPAISKKSVSITGVPKKTFSYVSGGPVFQDSYSGARLMIYHAEDGGNGRNFYSMLGMAISTDGQEFRDLGLIIRPHLPAGNAEVGGGSFAIVNGHLNVYYRDTLADGSTAEVAVARAPMAELMTNALSGRSTAFTKYYNGGWSQPGIGGRAAHIENVNSPNSWLGMSYNDHLGQLVMVSSQWSGDGGDLYYATSPDGITWAPRKPLAVDSGEQFYPTIIGTGADPTHSGQSFYVYYTDSQKGAWSRWSDAQLRRRAITISSPANPNAPANSLGYTANWTSISDYESDFQAGSPAEGWKYAWDPKGKVGKSAAYASLLWSDSAQAYNTTGAATMIPNPKAHKEDFLSLTADGGHPGQSKYMPIAGYTIQADDGAGLYRLTDSSIQKSNSTLATKEDGLSVLVYVNDTLIGAGQSVLANGLLASFDRMLGSLNVGDTVWVMVNPLKSQIDDAFMNFDFSLQRLVYSAQYSGQTQAIAGLSLQSNTVPEPSTLALLLMAIGGCCVRRRR
jgi:PEP-CTERM motif